MLFKSQWLSLPRLEINKKKFDLRKYNNCNTVKYTLYNLNIK